MPLLRDRLDSSPAWVKQLLRFGVVGGLGVFVNMAVLIVLVKLLPLLWPSAGIAEGQGIWLPILGTGYNVRWYHVMSAIAFLVANLFNFQLNRWWTFGSHKSAGWLAEYWPFLTVGLISLACGQVVITALLHPYSPIALPATIFDGSTGLRNRQYWANLISIGCTIPISFVVNKFWTFRSVRSQEGIA